MLYTDALKPAAGIYIKEILAQTWNIDIGLAFLQQDAKDIDPAVLIALIETVKNIKGKEE